MSKMKKNGLVKPFFFYYQQLFFIFKIISITTDFKESFSENDERILIVLQK